MNLEALGAVLGRSTATAQRYCLRPGETGYVHPSPAVGQALKEWSGGHVHLGNCSDLWTPEIDAAWLAAGAFPAPAPAAEAQPEAAS